MNIINNYVLVKPDTHYDKVLTADGSKVLLQFLDTYFEPDKHWPTSGIVMGAPPQLRYEKIAPGQVSSQALRFNGPLEVQKGDRVIFHYHDIKKASERNMFVRDETPGTIFSSTGITGKLFAIRYDNIYLRIREDQINSVNGFMIVEPVTEEIQSVLAIPQWLRKKKSISMGIIRYTSSPLEEYRNFPDLGPDADDVQVGDTIVFEKFNSIPLQYSMHQIIDRGKTLYRMQRRDIVCKLKQAA